MSNTALGDHIRAERERVGFSQEELARLAELSVKTVSQVENGHQKSPRFRTLRQIALALSIDVDQLLKLLPATAHAEVAS